MNLKHNKVRYNYSDLSDSELDKNITDLTVAIQHYKAEIEQLDASNLEKAEFLSRRVIECDQLIADLEAEKADRCPKELSQQVVTFQIDITEEQKAQIIEQARSIVLQDIRPKWVDVDVKLPPTEETVIVTLYEDNCDNPYYIESTGWYYNGMWVVDNEVNGKVVAWIPLPKPWRPGEDIVKWGQDV